VSLKMLFTLAPAETANSFALDVGHALYMHALRDADSTEVPSDVSERISATYGTRHVDATTLYSITNVGLHWVLFVINNESNTITTFDPLGVRKATRGRNNAMASRLEEYLKSERARLGRAARPQAYNRVNAPRNTPLQNDSTSCGAFCFAYVYFKIIHGRYPTRADFSGEDHFALRLAITDALVTGKLKRGHLPT